MPENQYSQILFSVGCDSNVVHHCETVASIASQFSGDSVDDTLVHVGSIMHDIGRSTTHDISHAQTGAQICCELGESEALIEIVLRHVGAGLDADECTLLGLLPMDCVPRTLEEKIVAHADNLTRESRMISIEERMTRIADLSNRSKKKIWRLAMEIEQLG